MISEELLERGLGTAGDGYDLPPAAVDDILGQLQPQLASDDAGRAQVRRWRPSRRQSWLSAAAALVVLVVVAFAAGGGGGTPSTRTTVADSNSAAQSAQPPGVNAPGKGLATTGLPETSSASGSKATSLSGSTMTPTGPDALAAQRGTPAAGQPGLVPAESSTKVVKTGSLDLQVDKSKVAVTVNRLAQLAHDQGGYAADSQINAGSEASGSVTLRVPVDAFDATVTKAAAYGKVLSSDRKGVDVTAQFVDLQARLKSVTATRDVYLKLLAKATTIGEILSVQERVNDIQTQVEQLQGQLKLLTEQTSYGTLTVSVDQKIPPVATAHEQSGISKAFHRSVSRFVHGVEAIIGIVGPVLLVVLLLGLGWLVAKLGYRLVRRQLV